jgi:hypothetical protein
MTRTLLNCSIVVGYILCNNLPSNPSLRPLVAEHCESVHDKLSGSLVASKALARIVAVKEGDHKLVTTSQWPRATCA